MTELELTEMDIGYIVAALLLASEDWGDPDCNNALALAEKFRDFHNRGLYDDQV